MGYSLHIERSEPITISEWLAVVEATGDLRIDESDSVVINPLSGDEIRIPSLPATVALWFSETEEWVKVFEFRRGKISFNANDWEDSKSPVRARAFELARKLNAEIVGDEGEVYTN